jgi:hypothetical protein
MLLHVNERRNAMTVVPDPVLDPPKTTTHDVLIKAVKAIEENGWGQLTYKSALNGTVCAVGALVIATDGDPFDVTIDDIAYDEVDYSPGTIYAALALLEDVLTDRYHYLDTLMTWNDVNGRTKEQVLELFDHAISKSLVT